MVDLLGVFDDERVEALSVVGTTTKIVDNNGKEEKIEPLFTSESELTEYLRDTLFCVEDEVYLNYAKGDYIYKIYGMVPMSPAMPLLTVRKSKSPNAG